MYHERQVREHPDERRLYLSKMMLAMTISTISGRRLVAVGDSMVSGGMPVAVGERVVEAPGKVPAPPKRIPRIMARLVSQTRLTSNSNAADDRIT